MLLSPSFTDVHSQHEEAILSTTPRAHVSLDTTDIFLREMKNYPTPTDEEQLQLFHQYQVEKSEDARETIILRNMGLVIYMAKRLRYQREDLLDLIQDGVLGLITAVRRYKPSRGRFITYAMYWIRYSILRNRDNTGNMIRVPVIFQARERKIQRAADSLRPTLLRDPDPDEIAAHLDWPVQRVQFILSRRISQPLPMHTEKPAPAAQLQYPDPRSITPEQFNQCRTLLETAERHIRKIKQCLTGSMTERDVSIFLAVHGLDTGYPVPMAQVGQEYGLTRERIRVIVGHGWNALYARGVSRACSFQSLTEDVRMICRLAEFLTLDHAHNLAGMD